MQNLAEQLGYTFEKRAGFLKELGSQLGLGVGGSLLGAGLGAGVGALAGAPIESVGMSAGVGAGLGGSLGALTGSYLTNKPRYPEASTEDESLDKSRLTAILSRVLPMGAGGALLGSIIGENISGNTTAGITTGALIGGLGLGGLGLGAGYIMGPRKSRAKRYAEDYARDWARSNPDAELSDQAGDMMGEKAREASRWMTALTMPSALETLPVALGALYPDRDEAYKRNVIRHIKRAIEAERAKQAPETDESSER